MYILIEHLLFDNFYMQIESVYTNKKLRLLFINRTLGELDLFTDFYKCDCIIQAMVIPANLLRSFTSSPIQSSSPTTNSRRPLNTTSFPF